ncbi:glycine/betaine ABC transporter substrate-binding protein [Salicibibacter cibi]|uniref:Glycine/betaine ABC transporter substrate-binding protein n=1 Tax=Salicibibacter cibi TaxID=2743001 RepID=A0A7T7CFH0_9BACI|nr:glycine betaine ABC transporter substrate-binding protein [Salicibibacter cibi]QQK80150.1 glycine/betaine ABC transporter substrate-binding protein [Salicibibacter cibi]
MKKQIALSLPILSGLLLSACGENDDTINFGTQQYTDPKILAHIVEGIVEDRTEYNVEITKDINASPQVITSLEQGEFDIATLYSGEVYNNHFDGVEFTTDAEETFRQAQEGFEEHFNFTWYDKIGYTNNYVLAVNENVANEHNPEQIEDLEAYADQLNLGTDNTWLEREGDGYRDFQETYDFSFNDERGMNVRLMYEAVENDELDVVTGHSVDPQIIELNMKTLEDNKDFFPSFEGAFVANNDMVEEYPEVDEILQELQDSIDTETMTELIYEVDLEGRSEEEVAYEWLEKNGWLD